MFYHSREMKYVEYDKVYPPTEDKCDELLINAYKWLSKYCGGYCPQIWLSRSKSNITGYKRKNIKDGIMFGFENIIGFPVDYESWCFILGSLINCKDPIKEGDQKIIEDLEDTLKDLEKENVLVSLSPNDEKILYIWKQNKNLNTVLKKALFIENDQVVVPSLNLKSAKVIYCRNERQVKELRHMGFIKDRIKILNAKFWTY